MSEEFAAYIEDNGATIAAFKHREDAELFQRVRRAGQPGLFKTGVAIPDPPADADPPTVLQFGPSE